MEKHACPVLRGLQGLTLMMEAVFLSQILVTNNTKHHKPEDQNLNICRC